jgi:hypothetical protein
MAKVFRLIFILWFLIILVYRLTICFSYKPELTNGESNNIWKAINVAAGKNIYNDPEKLPIEVFQYNPLSELPIIGFAKLFDNQSQNYLYNITSAGRCYQLICSLFLAFLIYKLCSVVFKISKTSSILASLSSITFLTTTAFTIRPDATLLVFLFACVYTFGLYIKSEQKKWLLITSLLILLSFLTKQDGIFVAFPIGLYLLIFKQWKQLLIFSGSTLLFLIVTLYSLHSIFGYFYWINTFKGLKNTMSIHQMIAVFDRANSFFGFFIVTGVVLSIYNLFKGAKTLKFYSLINLFYLIISLGISTKIGSWVNYYTPNVIITILLIFGTLYTIRFKNNNELKYIIYGYITISSLIFLSLQVYNYTIPFIKSHEQEYKNVYNDYKKLKNEFPLAKNEFIFTPTPLLRNFYALNNCMINTEYYNQASYNYYDFKIDDKENLKYIISKKEEILLVNNIVHFFPLI